MDAGDIFNILVIVAFFLLPLLDRKKKKGGVKGEAKSFRLPKSFSDDVTHVLSKKFPTLDEVQQAENVLRHRGELLPNETMWQPDVVEEAVQTPPAVDDMRLDEAEAALRDAAHTAAYERAAKIPGMQPKPVMPRIELTAEKAREAIVLATILGAPKARRK